MTTPLRPINDEPLFNVGDRVITPSGRIARVDSIDYNGKCHLTYLEAETVLLNATLLRRAARSQ